METKAQLQFISHKFIDTKIKMSPNQMPDSELHINIESKAMDNHDEGKMRLELSTTIWDDNKNVDISVVVSAIFGYDKSLIQEMKDSFFKYNAPAIVFPFVRAYINTLTSLSGIKPIVLPTINFSPSQQ